MIDILQFRRYVQALLAHHADVHLKSCQSLSQSPAARRRVFFVTNGLAEMADLDPKTLAQRSHFQLIMDLSHNLSTLGVNLWIVDVRHPLRTALFKGPQVVKRVTWDSSVDHKSIEACYSEAQQMFFRNLDDMVSVRVVGVDPTLPLSDALQSIACQLGELGSRADDLWFHSAGILSAYFVEPLIPRLIGSHYLYCFTPENTTLMPEVYEGALSANPGRPGTVGLTHLERPGSVAGVFFERTRTDSHGGSSHVMSIAGPAVLLIGRVVHEIVSPEYVKLIRGVAEYIPGLKVMTISENTSMTPGLRALETAGIAVEILGYQSDLFEALTCLSTANVVVCNPPHTGNGGSLTQAALAGLPVLVFQGNGSELNHPLDHIAGDSQEARHLLSRLLADEALRCQWVDDARSTIRSRERASRCALQSLLGG